ncbi:hypothetical protein L6452_35138 [Arctium lappa]|uniref:Uncharacterized protein n=1 Tax=Arctium lappa TaxID=4217 RepID=A0ACB8YK38_ARCLA|nr:hypothetical protein L6452_35138 [Arctium lappa]
MKQIVSLFWPSTGSVTPQISVENKRRVPSGRSVQTFTSSSNPIHTVVVGLPPFSQPHFYTSIFHSRRQPHTTSINRHFLWRH